MCDPVTIMAVTAAASTAFSVKQARDQGKFQSGVAEFNARTAANEAEATRSAATAAENTQRQRTAELLSRQRAQLGAANVDIGYGSALQLQEDTLTLGEADALRIRSRGDQAFDALGRESMLSEAQGDYAKTAARNKQIGSLLSGASDIAGTGVADKWFTPQSAAKPATKSSFNLNLDQVSLGS
jgi:hypothetical protein